MSVVPYAHSSAADQEPPRRAPFCVDLLILYRVCLLQLRSSISHCIIEDVTV